jgi:hypothetical protein
MPDETMTTRAIAPWFGAARLIAESVGEEMAGCRWVGVPFAGSMSELAHIRAGSIVWPSPAVARNQSCEPENRGRILPVRKRHAKVPADGGRKGIETMEQERRGLRLTEPAQSGHNAAKFVEIVSVIGQWLDEAAAKNATGAIEARIIVRDGKVQRVEAVPLPRVIQ